MASQFKFLVFGAIGGTGRHSVALALQDGHKETALVRNPAKLPFQDANLEVHQGSIADEVDIDQLVQGADFAISMLGEVNLQKHTKINTAFIGKLIPACVGMA